MLYRGVPRYLPTEQDMLSVLSPRLQEVLKSPCPVVWTIVILEIGAGINVPTVRLHSEFWSQQWGPQCTLIRVNPDYPDTSADLNGARVISLMGGGLQAVQEINRHLEPLLYPHSDNADNVAAHVTARFPLQEIQKTM